MLTELTSCHKSSTNISIDNRYYNRFIQLGRLIFPLKYNSAALITIPTTFGMAHARVTLARNRSPNLRPESDHRYSTARCFDCFANHYVSNNCFYVWSHVFAGTDSIAIDLMTMKDWLFSQHRPPAPRHQQSCHISSCWLLWLPVIAQWL